MSTFLPPDDPGASVPPPGGSVSERPGTREGEREREKGSLHPSEEALGAL